MKTNHKSTNSEHSIYRFKTLFPFLGILFLMSCSAFKMQIPDVGLQTTPMEIKGTDPIFNSKAPVTYGKYTTVNHRRGDTRDNTSLFLPSATDYIIGERESTFTQVTPLGKKANVSIKEKLEREGVSKISLILNVDEESPIREHWVRIEINTISDPVAKKYHCTIDMLNGEDFILVSDDTEEVYKIHFLDGYNFDMTLHEELVGSFRMLNRVFNEEEFRYYAWIKNTINEEEKLIISSVITAIASKQEIDIRGRY